MGLKPRKPPTRDKRQFRCPARTCTGVVVWVKSGLLPTDAGFWGCGDCGNVWPTEADLQEAISAIVKAYRYRKPHYRKTAAGWEPATNVDQSDYDELVAKEWDDV